MVEGMDSGSGAGMTRVVLLPFYHALHGRVRLMPDETVDSIPAREPFGEIVLVLPHTLCKVRSNTNSP